MTPAASAPPSTLRIVGLSKRIGERTVLDDLSFEVSPGEVVAILGASGAGKTTLLRCVSQLARLDAGQIFVGRQAIRPDSVAAGREVGFIFQQFNLIRRRNALDNVLAGRLGQVPTWRVVAGRFSRQDRQLALAALDRVGMLSHAGQRADTLSGGQQQRVAIARTLCQRSRFVLADEPVASLDPEAARGILGILRDIAHERMIAVLVSLHQVELAMAYADRIVGLRRGRLVVDEPAASLSDANRQLIFSA